jgi:hypothetical protein
VKAKISGGIEMANRNENNENEKKLNNISVSGWQ